MKLGPDGITQNVLFFFNQELPNREYPTWIQSATVTFVYGVIEDLPLFPYFIPMFYAEALVRDM